MGTIQVLVSKATEIGEAYLEMKRNPRSTDEQRRDMNARVSKAWDAVLDAYKATEAVSPPLLPQTASPALLDTV